MKALNIRPLFVEKLLRDQLPVLRPDRRHSRPKLLVLFVRPLTSAARNLAVQRVAPGALLLLRTLAADKNVCLLFAFAFIRHDSLSRRVFSVLWGSSGASLSLYIDLYS